MLQNKKVLLGVCGGIAAYKIASLIRLLKKEGAEVRVIMSPSAKEFITPLTLSTLSNHPVLLTFQKDTSGEWNNHVELGLWADYMIIAPATANTIAKCANGFCDNLLTAVYLSARCPVFFAPAMDVDMFAHPTTTNNLNKLKSYGNLIIDAEVGPLASGLTGKGRMAEPEHILEIVRSRSRAESILKDKKILITAGPTYEALDPVRFIGNHSSGKMGYSIADEFARYGGSVTLISGPSNEKLSHSYIRLIRVMSSDEMYKEALIYFPQSDIIILAAAVADYKPKSVASQKIKKKEETFSLELTKTVDIAAELGKMKNDNQVTIGFALETENETANAINKIKNKNFDFIVLNSLNDQGAGFKYDTNKITLIDKYNNSQSFELKTKKEVAQDIVEAVIKYLNGKD